MEHVYACLLCDEKIKSKEPERNAINLIKNHLKSSTHKLKYLVSILESMIYLKGVNHLYTLSIIT